MADPSAGPTPKYKRSARNYLIDPAFQLKYTGFLVLIALALSVTLGVLLYNANTEILAQTARTVEEGKETVKQGQSVADRQRELITMSNKLNEVVKSQIDTCYPGQEELAKSFSDAAAADGAKLQSQQKQLDEDKAKLDERAEFLRKEADELQARQANVLRGLVLVLSILVLTIGVAGIVFTHKIAGPIFKMKRLMRQVGEGKLIVREKLRKGDELQHFFDTLEQMVENMRRRQRAEIEMLSAAIQSIEDGAKVDPAEVAALRKVRDEMADHLEA
jgi:methyl-accepting chemotaxis protein